MSLESIVTGLREDAERIIDDVRAKVEAHASEIEKTAQELAAGAQSPIAQAIAGALHVPDSVLAKVADVINEFEARFVDIYGQGHADGHAAALAETAPADSATAPADAGDSGAEPDHSAD